MYLADYHVHSCFSPDAGYTMTEMAKAAADAGLQELCFTDHVEPTDLNRPGQLRRHAYDWEQLRRDFAAAQKAMGERITLRLGIELGDAINSIDHTKKLLRGAPELDFTIGSIHWLSSRLDHLDVYFFSPRSQREMRDGVQDYLERSLELAQWGEFCVLGHPTLPVRYSGKYGSVPISFDGFEAEMAEVFRTLVQKGCGIEVNTNRGNIPLPDAKWLKLYRELGGEIITLGSDAHSPAHVGCAVRERQELLRQCGFKRFCTFSRMKPVWHEL